jgi:hypothetical protein
MAYPVAPDPQPMATDLRGLGQLPPDLPPQQSILARFGNALTPGQPFGTPRPWEMSKRKQRKMAKLEAKLNDEAWKEAHPKKAANAASKFGYLNALKEAGADGKLTLSERRAAHDYYRPKMAKALKWLFSAPVAMSGYAPYLAAAGAVSKVVGNVQGKDKVERAGDEMLGLGGRGVTLSNITGLMR